MTTQRLAPTTRASFRTIAAILVLLPVIVSPVLAAQRHSPRVIGVPTTYDTLGSAGPDQTGSIASSGTFFPRHSMRSSTLGNAEFPERDPTAQNLGMTSGGGSN